MQKDKFLEYWNPNSGFIGGFIFWFVSVAVGFGFGIGFRLSFYIIN